MVDATRTSRTVPDTPLVARVVEVVILGAIVGVAVRLRSVNLDAYTGSFDEGIRAQQLLLMAAGYRPFQDIFASQGPLLLDLLYPFYLISGQTLAAARSGVVVTSLVALAAAWWLARREAGAVGGLMAALVLGVSPAFVEGSRLALAEVPSIAPALAALALLAADRSAPNRRLLVGSALACALALLVKPMIVHVGVPIAVLLAAGARGGIGRADGSGSRPASGLRRCAIDVALYGVVAAAACGVVVLLLGPAQVWDNLGAYRSGAGGAPGSEAATNLRLTANIMRREHAGLFVLAAAGIAFGLWRRPAITTALGAWALSIVAFFALYGDLADKHIVYLMPPLALLAAIGAGLAANDVARLTRLGWRRFGPRRLGLVGAGLVAVIAYAGSLPAIYAADQYTIREAPRVAAVRRDRGADVEIAALVAERTPADGWVLSDNPGAVFDARRRVIPYLVDTSGTRIDAGALTTPLVTEYVQRYRPTVIVTWPGRLGKLDDFTRSLPSLGYRLEQRYEIGWRVYVRE